MIIYIACPKTGSSSVRSILQKYYDEKLVADQFKYEINFKYGFFSPNMIADSIKKNLIGKNKFYLIIFIKCL